MDELAENLRTVSQPLANTRREFVDNISNRVNELSDSLRTLSDPLTTGGKDLALNISHRINELSEMLNGVTADPNRRSTTNK